MLGNVLFCLTERGPGSWAEAVPVPSTRLQCCLQLCVLCPGCQGWGGGVGFAPAAPGSCQASPASEHSGAQQPQRASCSSWRWVKLVLKNLCSRHPGGVEWQFLLCVVLILMRKWLASSVCRAAVHVQMENSRAISGQAGTGQCGSDTV